MGFNLKDGDLKNDDSTPINVIDLQRPFFVIQDLDIRTALMEGTKKLNNVDLKKFNVLKYEGLLERAKIYGGENGIKVYELDSIDASIMVARFLVKGDDKPYSIHLSNLYPEISIFKSN